MNTVPHHILVHQVFPFLDLTTIGNFCKYLSLAFESASPHFQILYSTGINPILPTLISPEKILVIDFPNDNYLSSLSHFTNLIRLNLHQNSQIMTLDSLSNLTFLNLHCNDQITTLDSLSSLTHLDLHWNNQITTLDSLSSLTHLDLRYNNQITTLEPLSSCTGLPLIILKHEYGSSGQQ